MLAEAEIAVRLELAPASLPDLIREALLNLGLPVEIPAGLNLDEVMTVLQRDKKRAGGVVRFALPLDVGQVQHGIEVAPQVLSSVLQAIQAS